jgi:hypothetical protein
LNTSSKKNITDVYCIIGGGGGGGRFGGGGGGGRLKRKSIRIYLLNQIKLTNEAADVGAIGGRGIC